MRRWEDRGRLERRVRITKEERYGEDTSEGRTEVRGIFKRYRMGGKGGQMTLIKVEGFDEEGRQEEEEEVWKTGHST